DRRAARSVPKAVDLARADLSRDRGPGGAPPQAVDRAGAGSRRPIDRVVVATRRFAGRAIAVDGVADLDPAGGDHAAAAEASEVSDETVRVRAAQRMLAVGLDRVVSSRWQG